MFYRKDFATKTNKSTKIRLNKFDEWENVDDAKLDITQTKNCYNFSFSSGALTSSYGFEQLALPNSQSSSDQTFTINATEILKAWFFPMYESYSNSDKYYVFYLAQDMRIYFFNVIDDKMMYPSDATFTEIPNGAAFRINTDNDTMFFASSADQTVGLNGMGIQTYENIPKFVSGCWYGPYLFLITIGDNNELQYSRKRIDAWNFDNVTTAELPDLRGGLTKLVALKDYLYLFTNFGITRLSLYSTNVDVAETHIYHSTSYIYPESISKSGEEIMFFTDDGLYRLKGSGVDKIDLPIISNMISNSNNQCSGVCHDGKYFLACNYDFNDGKQVGCESGEYINNAMVVYDMSTGEFEVVRGVDIKQLFTIQTPQVNKLCALFRGEKKGYIGQITHDGLYFGSSLAKQWNSPETDFGYAEKDKCITEVIVRPHTQAKLTIFSEKESQELQIEDSDKSQRFRVRVFGKVFSLSLDCQQGSSHISCPQITVEVIS